MSLRSYLISGIQAAHEGLTAGEAAVRAEGILKQHKMELEMDFSLRCRKEAIKDCIDQLTDMYDKELR